MKLPIPPPIIALILLAISITLHFFFPIAKIIYFPYNLLGIFGIIAGFWINVFGAITFLKLDTPIRPGMKPKKLVIKGPFIFSRNPMYLGFVLFLLGIAILFGSIAAFIAPVVFFLIIHFKFIPFEEKLMEKTFGKTYLNYKGKVRKWL